jgi:uncharacterized protein
MAKSAATPVQMLRYQAASLLVYQAVLTDAVGSAFLHLLDMLELHGKKDKIACLEAYGQLFHALAKVGRSWQEHLIQRILEAENPFTIQAQSLTVLPEGLVVAAHHDLKCLQSLYQCSSDHLASLLKAIVPECSVPLLPESFALSPDSCLKTTNSWPECLPDLVSRSQKNGVGLFASFRALRWQSGEIVGISSPDVVDLDHLVGYDKQKQILLKNTEFLLAGYSALHVLLYGSRGTGKSSLVKALMSKYGDQGLRLVEVSKADLQYLPIIVETLRSQPQKFVLFVDDLSFEEDENSYKALKVVLEGNLTGRPKNVVIYATSNRKHLIREFFGDRPDPSNLDEVHAWDTVQEKLSLSDRFGLTLTFMSADQKTYLHIVHQLAQQVGICLDSEDLERRALQWVAHHNGRSGRTARQFIDFLQAEMALPRQ